MKTKEKLELAQAVLESATSELASILKENIDGIISSYQAALEDNADAKSYPVGLGVVLRPAGRDVRVNAKISYGVKHTDETDGRLASINPSLFSKEN